MSEPDDEIIFPEAPLVGRMTCVSQERYAELMQQESRIAELEATLKRRDVELVARGERCERQRVRIAELEASARSLTTRLGGVLAAKDETVRRFEVQLAALRAEVEELQESLHMSEGTRKLAIRHRDAAEADAEALRECVMDLVNQHCFDREDDGILDSMGLSTNSEAFELLVQAGLAEYAREGYGRRQFIKLKNDPK